VEEVPLKRGKVGYLCGLLVYCTLVESGLKIMNSVTPLVMVLNIFSGEFFLCVTLYCCRAKCHGSRLLVKGQGLYIIKSGNDCSISVSCPQPPAILMHPVGESMFSRHESEIAILLRIKFPPSFSECFLRHFKAKLYNKS
jgi:hypothetical protein